MNIKCVLLFLIMGFYSCSENHTPQNTKTDSVPIPLKDSQVVRVNNSEKNTLVKDSILDCHQILVSLIRSSSLDEKTKNFKFKIWVDSFEDSIARLELTIKNKERGDDVPLGWIEMDLRKGELRDVSSDTSIQLTFDKVLFKQAETSCVFR